MTKFIMMWMTCKQLNLDLVLLTDLGHWMRQGEYTEWDTSFLQIFKDTFYKENIYHFSFWVNIYHLSYIMNYTKLRMGYRGQGGWGESWWGRVLFEGKKNTFMFFDKICCIWINISFQLFFNMIPTNMSELFCHPLALF